MIAILRLLASIPMGLLSVNVTKDLLVMVIPSAKKLATKNAFMGNAHLVQIISVFATWAGLDQIVALIADVMDIPGVTPKDLENATDVRKIPMVNSAIYAKKAVLAMLLTMAWDAKNATATNMKIYPREFVTKVMGSVIAHITQKETIVKFARKAFLERREMGEFVTISANQSQLSWTNKVDI